MDDFQRNKIIEDLDSHLSLLGYECLDVEWEAGSRTLRVFLESLAGEKVEIKDCVQVSRALEDWSSPLSEDKLEVSSPGIERPLRLPRHFDAAVGSRIKVSTRKKVEGKKVWVGRLSCVSSDLIRLDVEEAFVEIPWELIHRSHLVFDWNQV